MRKPRDKEHQFRGFIARIGGAMTETHPRGTQRARGVQNGCANACRGADGFDRCVG